jgi:hypothetical protein
MNRVTPDVVTDVTDKQIFVFGSNESGIHGAGAAKAALSFGAEIGVGFGFSGNTFAIPTKDWKIKTLSLQTIQHYVARFIAAARLYSELEFLVTPIGCGLAGYEVIDIAPFFRECIDLKNVHLPESFWTYLKQ